MISLNEYCKKHGLNELVKLILSKMYLYQIKNNITNMCLVHTLYLADQLNNIKPESCKQVSGVLHYYDENKKANNVIAHCWNEVNGKVIDASYDYGCKVSFKKTYYKSFKKLFLDFPLIDNDLKKYLITKSSGFQVKLNKHSKDFTQSYVYYDDLANYMRTPQK